MGILVLILLIIGAFVVLSILGSLTFAIIIPVLLWMFTGWLANRLVNGDRPQTAINDMVLGLIGGIVGSIIFGSSGLIGSLIFGTIGAIIVIVGYRLLSGNRATA